MYSFVLTGDKGRELFGTCLRFYDRYQGEEVTWDPVPFDTETQSSRMDNLSFMTMDIPRTEVSAFLTEELSLPPPDIETAQIRKLPSHPQTTRNKTTIPRHSCEMKTDLESTYPLSQNFAMKPGLTGLMAPRCIVLVTSEPFPETCKKLLLALFTLMGKGTIYPYECHVLHLLLDIPTPNSQVDLRFQLGDSLFSISHSPCNKLPSLDVDLGHLFSALDLTNVLKVFRGVLLERKVVLISKFEEKIAGCAMGLVGLLFPFKWKHVFVPVLPSAWIDYMFAPVSYLYGVTADCREDVYARCTGEELIVDLDNNSVAPGCTLRLSKEAVSPSDLPELPEHYGKKLIKRLYAILVQEAGCKLKPPKLLKPRLDPASAQVVRDKFFLFFVSIFKRYRQFLNFDRSPEDSRSNFDKTGFLNTCTDSSKAFFSQLLDTQMFANFCDSRVRTTLFDQHYETLLFDEHIAAKINRSKFTYISKIRTPFIDDRSRDLKTVVQVPAVSTAFSIPPETTCYTRFPTFNSDLAAKIGLPQVPYRALTEARDESLELQPVAFPFPERHRKQGSACIYTAWLQMWSRTLGQQRSIEHKARLAEILAVFEDMLKNDCRPSPANYKLVLAACVKENPSLALPIFAFMSRNKVAVDAETLTILQKSVAKIPKSQVSLSSSRSSLIVTETTGPELELQSERLKRVFTRENEEFVFAKQEVKFFIREDCVQCGVQVSVSELMRMWQTDADIEIECKACRRRFCPSLQVRVGLEIGSSETEVRLTQDRTSTFEEVALFSPFLVKKQTDALGNFADLMELRTMEHALFWNLIWHFHHLKLPYDFLLPYEPVSEKQSYRITIAEDSPHTAKRAFAPEFTDFRAVLRSATTDEATQTTISLFDPLA